MLVTLLKLSGHLDIAAKAAATVRQECALRWLNREQRTAVSNWIYQRHARYRTESAHADAGLFPFEREAIERYFPPAPARLLIGAVGTGREALALAHLGFTIAHCYDPSEELLARCQRNLARMGVSTFARSATHEELTEPIHGAPFDACILGWGSYTHVLGRAERECLLSTLRRASPTAPVLLSFLCRPPDSANSRAVMWQNQVRTLLDWLPGRRTPERGDAYIQGTGFVHLFTRSEIELEATASGYQLRHYAEAGYPHALLLPSRDFTHAD